MKHKRTRIVVSEDAKAIAKWLIENVSTITNPNGAIAFALMITTSRRFDRSKPVEDNRISGVEFTIPTPADLPRA